MNDLLPSVRVGRRCLAARACYSGHFLQGGIMTGTASELHTEGCTTMQTPPEAVYAVKLAAFLPHAMHLVLQS